MKGERESSAPSPSAAQIAWQRWAAVPRKARTVLKQADPEHVAILELSYLQFIDDVRPFPSRSLCHSCHLPGISSMVKDACCCFRKQKQMVAVLLQTGETELIITPPDAFQRLIAHGLVWSFTCSLLRPRSLILSDYQELTGRSHVWYFSVAFSMECSIASNPCYSFSIVVIKHLDSSDPG